MMEEWIKYINNPALVILLSEMLAAMMLFTLLLWVKSIIKKRRAMSALKELAGEIKQNNDSYKSQISELLKKETAKDPAILEEGLKKLLDGQEQLVKEVMIAVRTRDNEAVSNLGKSINGIVFEAVNIGRVSAESAVEKLEEQNEELNDKLSDTSSQMNELMSEYKSMFPEEEGEEENASADAGDESVAEEQDTLIDISDNLDELNNATPQAAEENAANEENTEESDEGTDLAEEDEQENDVVVDEIEAEGKDKVA